MCYSNNSSILFRRDGERYNPNIHSMLVYAANLLHSEVNHPPGGGDWLSYYSEFLNRTGFRDYIRRRLGGLCPCCWQDAAEVGAHIGFLSWKNRRAYIVPLCRRCCERHQSPLTLPADLMCVPVPADSSHFGRLIYPPLAVAYLRMQNPREAMQWDGRPVATETSGQRKA